jgi:hypothetical protein
MTQLVAPEQRINLTFDKKNIFRIVREIANLCDENEITHSLGFFLKPKSTDMEGKKTHRILMDTQGVPVEKGYLIEHKIHEMGLDFRRLKDTASNYVELIQSQN